MNLNDHTWNCPRIGCKKFVMAYTETGLRALTDEHIAQHIREDREIQQARNMAIEYIGPRRDYDVLSLSQADVCFLKTRGIAIDDKIEIDYAYEPKPSGNSELGQGLWAKTLNRAWLRGSDGTTK
jgi:hypothetical protein